MSSDYEKIVEEYAGKLYGYLMKILSNPEDVEDILQSVFLSFYAKMSAVNPNKYPSYLFRMAHNKAINYLKKENKYLSYDEFKHIQVTHPHHLDKKALNEEKLKLAIKKLKPKEMLALHLQFYEKKSYKEIAEIMGTTANAIDSLLFRAKKKLRIFLQDM